MTAKQQIFISYAHADNPTLDEDSKGWITHFVEKLEKVIPMRPSGSQVKCWMDYELEANRSLAITHYSNNRQNRLDRRTLGR